MTTIDQTVTDRPDLLVTVNVISTTKTTGRTTEQHTQSGVSTPIINLTRSQEKRTNEQTGGKSGLRYSNKWAHGKRSKRDRL